MSFGRVTASSPLANIAPASALTATQRVQGADEPEVPNLRVFEALTPGDLDFLEATYGYRPVRGGLLPAAAALIAEDRFNGKLPEGAALSESYVRDVLARWQVQGTDGVVRSLLSDEQLASGLSYLQQRGGRAATDVTA